MLFAELSAEGWAVVIGAVFLGLTQLANMGISYLRERAKRMQDAIDKAEAKAEAKADLESVVQKTTACITEVGAGVKTAVVKADVRQTLAIANVQDTQATAGQVETVRVMLNGEKTAMKRENAGLARQLADAIGTPEAIATAEAAERNLALHEAQLSAPKS